MSSAAVCECASVCARTVVLNEYICVHKHTFVQCVVVSLYLLHLSWHANPSVKVWDASRGVWLCGDSSCSNIQVRVPSLSVGLTPDKKDQSDCWQRQLRMTQEHSKRMSLWGQPFPIHKSCQLRAKYTRSLYFAAIIEITDRIIHSNHHHMLHVRTFCFLLRGCKDQIERGLWGTGQKTFWTHIHLLEEACRRNIIVFEREGRQKEMGHLSLCAAN